MTAHEADIRCLLVDAAFIVEEISENVHLTNDWTALIDLLDYF